MNLVSIAAVAISILTCTPAFAAAEASPRSLRSTLSVLPVEPFYVSAECEFRILSSPLSMLGRYSAPLASTNSPISAVLAANLFGFEMDSSARFGSLVGVGVVVTTLMYGRHAQPLAIFGVSYQQSFGRYWIRVSPSISYPFSPADYLLLNQPWAEFGYRVSEHIDASLSLSHIPLRIGTMF